jgi:flagellar hook assembly protein FlgD
MIKSQKKTLQRLVAATAMLMLFAAPVANAQIISGPPPAITNVSAVPATFNPNVDGHTTIYYSIADAPANVSAYIISGGQEYALHLPLYRAIGNNYYVDWFGELAGNPVAAGTYQYRILAQGAYGSDEATGYVTVTYSGTTPPPTGVAPTITNVSVNPNPFDPDEESTNISYTLNTQATVTARIMDGSSTVAYLRNSEIVNAGQDVRSWDGEYTNNTQVSEGIYVVEIFATNTAGDYTYSTTVTVDYDSTSTDGPDITDYRLSDDEFIIGEESVTIYFEMDEEADVTVTIRDEYDDVVRVFRDYDLEEDVEWGIVWNGRDEDGDYVDEGDYTFEIEVENSNGSDSVEGDIEAIEDDDDDDDSNTDDLIDDVEVDVDWFDPEDSERAKLTWDVLENDVTITVEIREDDGGYVRTLINDRDYDRGNNNWVYWNGRDSRNDIVDDEIYEFKIIAEKGNDRQVEYAEVEVDTDGIHYGYDDDDYDDNYGDLIDDIYVNPEIFDPSENERSRLYFDVLEDNVDIEVRILDAGRTVVELVDREYDEQSNATAVWDGEDDDGDEVSDDIYLFYIEADKSGEREWAYRWVEVDTDGIIIGFPIGGYCGGFTDVPYGSPFCKAVELMSQMGVFDGYSDGTFRPYAPINRAEVTKVILLALDIPILNDDGTNLGFWDVQRNAWYMPYLRTAQRLGIINGYPDGSFRPGANPNRVELLKIFLESTGVYIPHCNQGPFIDTPLNADTRWYMDYVCFAATNRLMFADASGRFYPGEPMTRGDVASLFYQFQRNGLFSQVNTTNYSNYYYTYDNYYLPGTYYTTGSYYDYNNPYYYGDAYYRTPSYYDYYYTY